MEFEAFSSENAGPLDQAACGICGRTFNQQVLAKHEPICAKSSQKTRKVFNSTKQRAEGTEINSVKTKHVGRPAQAAPAKTNNWRQKHEEFINAIRGARGVQKAIDSGGPLPPPPPPSLNPDYISCPHCSRRFNQSAAERHIDFCKEQAARKPRSQNNANDRNKQNARLQYKAPRLGPKQKSSPTSPSDTGSYKFGASTQAKPPAGRSTGGSSRVPLTSTKSAVNTAKRTPGKSGAPSNGMARTAGGGGGGGGGYGGGGYGDRFETDSSPSSPGSGRALRTGRTAEMYSDARELSAKQRQGMPKRYSSNENLHRYGNHSPKYGYNGTSPASSAGRPGSGRRGPHDTGYHSSSDESRANSGRLGVSGTRVGSGIAKFCHECGTKYPVPHARFCCECGVKRVMAA